MIQQALFEKTGERVLRPLRGQLLKWIGNKQKFAPEIISYFPENFDAYFEPFLGTGAVLATLGHPNSFGSDAFKPLIEIWQALKLDPKKLENWYADRWRLLSQGTKIEAYEQIKASYNSSPNGADLTFLSRACYGGVVRFRRTDGYMSTPCGAHYPISPASFAERVNEWHRRVSGGSFVNMDYKDAMRLAQKGDLIYCDPPYSHSQTILFGAQEFDFLELIEIIRECKSRGVYVALSIDGMKRSGQINCELPIPKGLFEKEIFVNCGPSMLKRFQMNGKTLENETVSDRLLLTY